MEIPVNNYDDAPIVERLTNEILERMQKNGYKYGAALHCTKYAAETLRKVLDKFKAKGFYCYYLRRFDGAWLELQVYNKPQPEDDGYCLNRLMSY